MSSRDYEMVSEKFWSLPQKPDEELNRDRLFLDDQILHFHLEREITRNLDGVRTILDAGGGTGRFSLWLAKQGYRVTHLDISMPMLNKAREKAAQLELSGTVEFVHGRLTDLSAYSDEQFDLVISLDAPVSYTYPKHQEVIANLIRVAKNSVVLCVSSRLGSFPAQFNPAPKKPFLIDGNDPDGAVQWYVREWQKSEHWTPDFARADYLLEKGLLEDPDHVFDEMINGSSPWPVTYLFRPEEMNELLSVNGLRNVRLAGPGALARTLPGRTLSKLMCDETYRNLFLERCYRFDSEPSVCGMGFHSLIASGQKTR